MAWLKRNLLLLAAILVALALLGVAGWYLYVRWQADAKVTEELAAEEQRLDSLVNRKVHPGTGKIDNIKATAREHARLVRDVLMPAKSVFPVCAVSNSVTSEQFQLELVNTLSLLRRGASNASVKIPEEYAFSFYEEERKTDFSPSILPMLVIQLEDVREIVAMTYDAKVHALLSVERPSAEVQAAPPMMGAVDPMTGMPMAGGQMGVGDGRGSLTTYGDPQTDPYGGALNRMGTTGVPPQMDSQSGYGSLGVGLGDPMGGIGIAPPGVYPLGKIRTNTVAGVVIFPYRIIVEGYSGELARIMTRFLRSSEVYIVKGMHVVQSPMQDTAMFGDVYGGMTGVGDSLYGPQGNPYGPQGNPYGPQGNPYGQRGRMSPYDRGDSQYGGQYGRGRRMGPDFRGIPPGPMPMMPPGVMPGQPHRSAEFLKEGRLQVELLIETVRLLPEAAASENS